MTPERRAKLTTAIDLIRAASNADSFDAEAVRNALIGLGARLSNPRTSNNHTIRLAGVTASCTWDAGEHLLTRWATNARAALQQADDQDGAGEEEE